MLSDEPSFLSTTRTSTELLEGLKSPDNHSTWQAFVDRYRPIIVGYGKRFGLTEADANDAAQETLIAFSIAYQEGKYERNRGRLRHWLSGIAHRQIRYFARKKKRETALDDTIISEMLESEHPQQNMWEQEWQKAVFRTCIEELKMSLSSTHFEAYILYGIQELPIEEVAEKLKMTNQAIYMVKHRANQRLKEMKSLFED